MPSTSLNLKDGSPLKFSPWFFATISAISIYLTISVLYLLITKPNIDEGAFLYASKLVLGGNIPYQDFAYHQMPLLPYIYSIPQIILPPSIYLGRATSVFFSLVSLFMCVLIARRYAGEFAGSIVAILFATFTYGIYFNSIVKTYPIILFFFTLTFFILSSKIKDGLKYPLAVISAICATMVRLPALFFAISITLYSIRVQSSKKIRFIVCLSWLAAITVLSFFSLPNIHAVKFDLFTIFVNQWSEVSTSGRIYDLLFYRIPSVINMFSPYLFLILVTVGLTYHDTDVSSRIYRNTPIPAISIGLILYAGSHFWAGKWHNEYLVPVLTSFFPIIAIMFVKTYDHQKTNTMLKLLYQGMLIATLLLILSTHSVRYAREYIDLSRGKPPLDKIKDVSAFVSSNSNPSDRILVIEGLWVAVDSGRPVLPGLTLSSFSYQSDMSTERAKELKFVNYDILLEYITHGDAKVVVFTKRDWKTFNQSGKAELLNNALLSKYKLALVVDNFGQRAEEVYVYLRRENQTNIS